MKDSLRTGLSSTMGYVVPVNRTVANLLPESDKFRTMPEVLATGFLVGLIEWACMNAIAPHLYDDEISLGVHMDISHRAPTVPGSTLEVEVVVTHIKRNHIEFDIVAKDDHATVCIGKHRRAVLRRDDFMSKLPTAS